MIEKDNDFVKKKIQTQTFALTRGHQIIMFWLSV